MQFHSMNLASALNDYADAMEKYNGLLFSTYSNMGKCYYLLKDFTNSIDYF